MAYVHWAFENMQQMIQNDPRIIFASAIRHIEAKKHIRIYIRPHGGVKPGSALAFLTPDRRYFIFLNKEDLSEHRLVARYRTAHELGHLMCMHLEEMQHLIDYGRGNLNGREGPYHHYRQVIEHEADMFAACMLMAVGEVIEREIISEEQYLSELEPFCNTPLNNPELREAVRNELRKKCYISPPVPLLCQAISKLFPDEDTVGGVPRNHLPKLIHDEYRTRLGEPEVRIRPAKGACKQCVDRDQPWCSETGHA